MLGCEAAAAAAELKGCPGAQDQMLAMERSVVSRSGAGTFMPHWDMLCTIASSIKGLHSAVNSAHQGKTQQHATILWGTHAGTTDASTADA